MEHTIVNVYVFPKCQSRIEWRVQIVLLYLRTRELPSMMFVLAENCRKRVTNGHHVFGSVIRGAALLPLTHARQYKRRRRVFIHYVESGDELGSGPEAQFGQYNPIDLTSLLEKISKLLLQPFLIRRNLIIEISPIEQKF